MTRFRAPARLEFPEDRGPVIAIVGGGASGTLAAVHLLRSTTGRDSPLRIALIDRHGRQGLGQAYSTSHPDHLLNAPAGRMSALTGDPDHLVRWAATAGLAGQEFLPRQAYGRYLRDLLAGAEQQAHPLSRVTGITQDVLGIRHNPTGRPLRLVLAGDCIDADIVVLATGNPAPVPPLPLPDSPRCIVDPWAPGSIRTGPRPSSLQAG